MEGAQDACWTGDGKMNEAWREVIAELEATRRRLVEEIVHYPPPIPRCDVQYNTLLEERAGVAREIFRAQELSRGKGGEDAEALAEFVRMSAFLSGETKGARALAVSVD